MPTFDAKNAKCHVFTQKDGLLSAIAHDLQIEVTDFTVKADNASVAASFNPSSLRVMHAMKDGQPIGALSDKNKQEIEGNISNEVLEAGKFNEITFVSTSVTPVSDGAAVSGNLTLHGTTKPVSFNAKLDGQSYVADIPIHQPDFGIKPYSAMMGTLKIKPALTIRLTLPRW